MLGENGDNPELCEYLVRVEWTHTLPAERAIWENALFANQNTVCPLRQQHTLERLQHAFALEQERTFE